MAQTLLFFLNGVIRITCQNTFLTGNFFWEVQPKKLYFIKCSVMPQFMKKVKST